MSTVTNANIKFDEALRSIKSVQASAKSLSDMLDEKTAKDAEREAWWQGKPGMGVWLILPHSSFAWAFFYAKMWLWFVVPFFGVPAMPIAIAGGLLMIISALTFEISTGKTATRYDILVRQFIPWLYLFLGWVWTLFL